MVEGVPLVIPEVNPQAMKDCKIGKVAAGGASGRWRERERGASARACLACCGGTRTCCVNATPSWPWPPAHAPPLPPALPGSPRTRPPPIPWCAGLHHRQPQLLHHHCPHGRDAAAQACHGQAHGGVHVPGRIGRGRRGHAGARATAVSCGTLSHAGAGGKALRACAGNCRSCGTRRGMCWTASPRSPRSSLSRCAQGRRAH